MNSKTDYFTAATPGNTGVRPFSFTDLHDIKNISSINLSPDNTQLLAVVTRTDISSNSYIDEIVLIDIATNKLTPLTEGASPAWSPDGKTFAYEYVQNDQGALFLFDVQKMEKRFLSTVYSSEYFMGHLVEKNFAWSPNGKYIAYAGALHSSQSGESANVRIISRLNYKTKGGRGREVFTDDLLTHIWCIAVDGNEPFLLTTGQFNEHSFSWSPDNKHIAFISNRTADPDNNHNSDLWSVNVQTKEIKRLTSGPGTRSCARWSPDGKHIAYLGVTSQVTSTDSVADDTQVYITDTEGQRSRCLSGELNRRVENIQWRKDGSSIYFTAGDAGSTNLYEVSVEGTLKPVVEGNFCVREYAESADGQQIFLIRTEMTAPAELFVYSRQQKTTRALTDLNAFVGRDCIAADAEMFWFNSFDQTKVQGWIIKPFGFESGKKFPLSLVIHGGPHNMFGYEFEERMQVLSAQGLGVLFINPRGSHGYGQAFSSGCVLNWGGNDYRDLMAGVDHVIGAYDWVDQENLLVTGQSYGGFMSNWIITQTNRFRAAVVDGGISNLVSFAGTSLYYLLMESEFNGKPWDNYPLLWQWSPLRNVKNVRTPTLFLHGDKDNEVPVSQAEEMFYALKDLGVETMFIRYLGEGHGWRPNLLPQNREDLMRRMTGWFETYIK